MDDVLLNKLPKKYHNYIKNIYKEGEKIFMCN